MPRPAARRTTPPGPPRPPRPRRRPGHSDRRLRAALLTILFVLSLFAGRLFQLQGLDASALAADALAERSVTRTLPAHRGDIVDADGQVLATTVERKNVTVDQTIFGDWATVDGVRTRVGTDDAVRRLAAVLGMSQEQVRAAVTGDKKFAYVVKDVSPEMWREVADLRIPGVFAEAAPRRTYPNGSVGASYVGYLGAGGAPLAGLELARDDVLAGTPGTVAYERSLDGRQIPGGVQRSVDPVAGSSLRLTVDRDIQWKAQTLLAEQVAKSKAEAGYVVVQDVRTGNILAMASTPTFDPNEPETVDENTIGNRALLDIFEPGSTSKLMTAAAAVEEGVVTPSTKMVVDGEIRRGGRTFHDSHAHGPENMTFAGVIAASSNVGSIMAGEKLSPETMYGYMKRFGIATKSGLGLPESRGILADPQDWSASQRYTVLFGQGLSVNALQATEVFSTIANGGVRMPPRLVDATVAPDGTERKEPAPQPTRVVSPQTATAVGRMLEAVVGEEGGTGRTAQIPGYRVAGKTGTAQAADSECGCYRGYTASFIGYAPADKPAITVSVIIQRPQGAYYGSVVSAPVFKEVMSYALAQRGIPPTGAKAEPLPLSWR